MSRWQMANIIPPDALLGFYRDGLFPMAGPEGIRLFSPDPRGIIPIDGFKVPHGMKKSLKDERWKVTIDTAFENVMLGCADRDETWIDETIFLSYSLLHRQGHAHSVEVWRDGELAGGLYGVSIGAAFFGESMFHRVTGASKIALFWLVEILRSQGFKLLDTQWITPHLAGFGAIEVPRSDYLKMLAESITREATFKAESCDFSGLGLLEDLHG
ncbi:MAG: leucyl/phenylalanyl-tRNA--protein transferase [Terrimicrobiaceae bacterium]